MTEADQDKMFNQDIKDDLLPPRPGEKAEQKKEIKGMPFAIYIDGKLVQMSKSDALDVMSQILNILCYQDNLEGK